MTFWLHWLRRHRTDRWTSQQGLRRGGEIVFAKVYEWRCITCRLNWRYEVE